MIRVLIPDGESYFACPVVRCLSRHADVRIHIASRERWVPQRFSRHCSGFHRLPSSEDDRAEELVRLARRHHLDVILPVSEEGAQFVARYRDALAPRVRSAGPHDIHQIERAVDKATAHELVRELGIPAPRTIRLTHDDAFETSVRSMRFPVLVKARRAGGGSHIHRLESREALKAFLEAHPEIRNDYIIQQFHRGADLSCNVLCRDGELLTWAFYEGRSPGVRPFAPPLEVEFLEDDQVLEHLRRLLKALSWNGVADVDWIRDAETGEALFLEINARFWSSLLAARAAGIDFPYLACRAALGEEVLPAPYRHIRYLAMGRSVPHVTKRVLSARPAPISIRDLSQHISDPLPLAVRRFRTWWNQRSRS
ncbi:MAG: ATP-grasp domain-containing protein [Planctomycetota bacterium]